MLLGQPPRRSPLDPERTGRILSHMRKPKRKQKGFVVWKSPFAAAIDAIAEDLLHYKLTLPQKKELLEELKQYPHASMIIDNDGVGTVKQYTHFNPLSITYHPHFWSVPAGGKRTPKEHYEDYPLLAEALEKWNEVLRKRTSREQNEEKDAPTWITWYLTEAGMTASSIRKAVKMFTGTQGVSAFSPAQAAAIHHHFGGGVIWDMSAGWGGRMLGAMVCDRVTKYIGCDPATRTYKGLLEMRDELLPMVLAMRKADLKIELYELGSETPKMRAKLPKGGVDLCWTSPPYFSTEKYSNEETQSWKTYLDPDSWLNGFLGGTLDNCEYCLKQGGTLAINLDDAKEYKKLTRKGKLKGRELTDDFKALAESKGWRLIETLQLELSAGPDAKQKHGKHKREPIFVFKKKS